MNTVIKVENLSKQYRLGLVNSGTMRDDFNRWWHQIRGKENPLLKIGETNDRTLKGNSNYVWALKDINFEVQQGDVLGIIGRNGAGKSTLLKILSKITAPTTGTIKTKGRIASLLEVGTGFHPELTGKENIFLNGAILGMRRHEIIKKFDEIVAFAGIERYIDTPVKRYSSGMYVRLAFAVAAHLESEILIIDEVLAVGDAEFQKKCLGKMKDVATHGRTVIFVSHNMEAVKNLCETAFFMENGEIVLQGKPAEIIETYLERQSIVSLSKRWDYKDAPGNEYVKIKHISIRPEREDGKNIITVKSPLKIQFDFWNECEGMATNLSLHLYAATGECVFAILSQLPPPLLKKGLYSSNCIIPEDFLNIGIFSLSVIIVKDGSIPVFDLNNLITFEVEEEREKTSWHGKYPGFVRPKFNFKIVTNNE